MSSESTADRRQSLNAGPLGGGKMPSDSIESLLREVRRIYGPQNVQRYGSSPREEHGVAFTITGIEATFSVHTQEGKLAPGMYDVQIEAVPPGDYIWTDVVSVARFLELIQLVSGPVDAWPTTGPAG